MQALARADGLSFAFPLRVFGLAGVVSAPLLGLAPLRVYEAWWMLVAIGAPILIMRHYRRRLRARGVGIGSPKALRYVFFGEALAVALWVQPYHPIMINAPWLAFVPGAVLAGRTWREPFLYVVAAVVGVLVLGAAALRVPMAVTDLAVGFWLCASAAVSRSRTDRRPAGMPAPFLG